MKKLILSFAVICFSALVFGQEKEIDAAYAAIEANDIATAKAGLAQLSGQIDSNLVSPESKAKYYYTAGKIALSEGRSIDAAKMFSSLRKFEDGTAFALKNKDSKETEYYYTKSEADAAAAKGNYNKPKELTLSPSLILNVEPLIRSKAETMLNQANAASQSNRNEEAGDKFLEASYLVEALGGDSGLFKYNAALSYHKGNNFQKAFDIYKELINEGYTGANSKWVGTDKKTGEQVPFGTKEEAELQQKLGIVSNIKEIKSDSVERELSKYALSALGGLKKYDPITESISNKFPNDQEIQNLVGNVYYFSGKEDMFISKLEQEIKANPNNAQNYFNLGVINMDKGNDEKAKEYFEKATQVDPNYKNAYTNLALLIVRPEKEYIEIINNNLGSSAKEKGLYKEYSEKRKALYIKAIPYLEKAFELDKNDYDAARTLRQAYQAAEMFDKEDSMRAIENSLKK
ncbi:MAG: tetratricopeptide repeat protein [Flavobacteriia bacterium]|nr:tetratricopeptide repeat protein [Flavobacteriia bacterium]